MRTLELSRAGRRYGWRPSPPSLLRPQACFDRRLSVPNSVDLRGEMPAVYDQGQLGSCVDNAIAGLIEWNLMKAKYPWAFTPSRLFNYYNARSLEGTVDTDSGSTVADGVAAVQQYGICPEQEADGTSPAWLWPYDTTKFTQKPPDACYKDAVLHKATQANTVGLDRNSILNCLAGGMPFTFGFTVNQSFESQATAQSGIVQVPGNPLLDPQIGGHCIIAVGYELNKPMGTQGVVDWLIVRNSWGASWGDQGYCYFPLTQMAANPNISSDAHIITLVG